MLKNWGLGFDALWHRSIRRSDVVRTSFETSTSIPAEFNISQVFLGLVWGWYHHKAVKKRWKQLVLWSGSFDIYIDVVNHRRPSMTWLFFVRFNATLEMFWQLRPQCVSLSFRQQNLPKQSLSHIGVPLGLALFLVNLFDFLIQRRPSETWRNSTQWVDFDLAEYC